MLEDLAPQLVAGHGSQVAPDSRHPLAFDPALDGPEHALHEHGLRAGEAAPDATPQAGDHEQGQAEAQQQEEEQVEVLVGEGAAEEVGGAPGDVELHRGVAADAHERQAQVDHEQDQPDHVLADLPAAAHVGRVEEVARAVGVDGVDRVRGRVAAHLAHSFELHVVRVRPRAPCRRARWCCEGQHVGHHGLHAARTELVAPGRHALGRHAVGDHPVLVHGFGAVDPVVVGEVGPHAAAAVVSVWQTTQYWRNSALPSATRSGMVAMSSSDSLLRPPSAARASCASAAATICFCSAC